eukprot:evm.model.scf_151.2 EVM.evm.TU.scf_151.2   scf_151:33562-33903(-)
MKMSTAVWCFVQRSPEHVGTAGWALHVISANCPQHWCIESVGDLALPESSRKRKAAGCSQEGSRKWWEMPLWDHCGERYRLEATLGVAVGGEARVAGEQCWVRRQLPWKGRVS